MNKTQLIAAVADRLGMPKTTAEAAVAAVIDTIQTAVADGDKVTIIGFGTWETAYKPAREGRNPSTGQTIQLSESWTPKFRAGADFKALVDQGARSAKNAA